MGLRLMMVVCFKFVVVLVIEIYGSQCCVREEREALLSIKSHLLLLQTYHDPLSSWVSHPYSDCCTWNRVTCHPDSSRVSTISLQNLNVPHSDNIDFSLYQNFQQLTTLNFSQQDPPFEASTPFKFTSLVNTQDLANISSLEVLILRGNYLDGPVPIQELCGLKKIRVLDFSRNSFHGPLPSCLANLTSLEALDLSDNVLTGLIPVSVIASLTSLEYLSLMYNDFQGSFPLNSFANNSKLKVLTLEMYNSDFHVDTETEDEAQVVPFFQLQVLHMPNCRVNFGKSGTFPSFLFYQHDLLYLDLSNNNLEGAFPNWLIFNNTNLRSLILHHNSFTGSFDLPLANINHPLVNLQLSDNKMEGNLPKNIGLVFPNLESLNVSGNGFDGDIPASLGNMSKLNVLDLSRNIFSGEVQGSLLTDLSSLRYLILSHNKLKGQPFSSSTLNSSSLRWLFLDNNNLNGSLENNGGELWKLPRLETLDVSNNNFSGFVPDSIGNLSFLKVINLSGNNFTGTLPRVFCTLDLIHLHLSHNKLSGSIPACYMNMDLSSLHLQGNTLEGSIPTLRRTTSFLSTLDLRDNKLSGGIPDWILKMRFLRALLLCGNQLQGQLPDRLCRLRELSFLDLSRNNFTGNIPACFYNVSFGEWKDRVSEYDEMIFLSDSLYWYNHLHLLLFFEQNAYHMTGIAGGVEVEFRTKDSLLQYRGDILRFMSGLDLSCNHLIGEIPYQIGSFSFLYALNLSHNHFHGSIPSSFGNLTSIESLDLSYNKLNGEIPLQLQNLNNLAVFNVSYNNLSGIVPSNKQFGTFDQSSFLGNPYLRLNNSNRGNSEPVMPTPSTFSSKEEEEEEDEFVIDFTSFIWSFGASYVAVLVILVTVLWINPYWRKLWFYFIETCLYRCLYPYPKDAFS